MLATALGESVPLLGAMGGVGALIFGALMFNRRDAREAVQTMKDIVHEQAGLIDRLRNRVTDVENENTALKVELASKDDELRHYRRRG